MLLLTQVKLDDRDSWSLCSLTNGTYGIQEFEGQRSSHGQFWPFCPNGQAASSPTEYIR